MRITFDYVFDYKSGKCACCGKPSKYLDSFHPYQLEENRCEQHKDFKSVWKDGIQYFQSIVVPG